MQAAIAVRLPHRHLGFASAMIILSVLIAVQRPSTNVIGMMMLLQFVVSFGFILPVNAPQNMIAYGIDTFPTRDYSRTGMASRWPQSRCWCS